jgi:hypothetical protein
MPATSITREHLSDSTNGKPIHITATASGSAHDIHTATSTTDQKDEIWIWVSNNHTDPVNVYILWGGTSTTTDMINTLVPPRRGSYLMIAGNTLDGGLVVKAYASVTAVVNVFGHVNRITEET